MRAQTAAAARHGPQRRRPARRPRARSGARSGARGSHGGTASVSVAPRSAARTHTHLLTSARGGHGTATCLARRTRRR
eukprot:4082669-Prymnesium_polylepis.1